jgi:hypothetical protein
MKGLMDLKLFGALCLTATACWASTITTATSSPGNTFSYLGANFVEVEKGSDLAGATATAVFANGSFTCTFDSTGTCADAGGNFSVVVQPATSNTLSANWEVSDLRGAGSSNDMISLTINAGLGNSSFSPCAPGGVPDTNDQCGGAGVAKSAETTSSGSPASASVFYTNELHIANQVVDATEWGVITLTFNGTFRSGAGNNSTGLFQFKIDTDFVGPLTADVPEPATMAMMGFALVGLATLKLRRKRTK